MENLIIEFRNCLLVEGKSDILILEKNAFLEVLEIDKGKLYLSGSKPITLKLFDKIFIKKEQQYKFVDCCNLKCLIHFNE